MFQRQILRLYRDIIKFANSKQEPLRTQIKRHARKKFDMNRYIPRANLAKVEIRT